MHKIFDTIRQHIAHECERVSPFDQGAVELDESYFGAAECGARAGVVPPTRCRCLACSGAGGAGKVYTQIGSAAEILPIIRQKAERSVVLYSDGLKTYDGLTDFGYKRHYRIKHSHNEFAQSTNHINGIENFRGLCKVRLARFRGIHKHMFYYHLKECEFRFNMRHQNMYQYLLKSIRNRPLKLS